MPTATRVSRSSSQRSRGEPTQTQGNFSKAARDGALLLYSNDTFKKKIFRPQIQLNSEREAAAAPEESNNGAPANATDALQGNDLETVVDENGAKSSRLSVIE